MRKEKTIELTCPECRHTYRVTRETYRKFQEEYGSELYCSRCQYQKFFGDVHSE